MVLSYLSSNVMWEIIDINAKFPLPLTNNKSPTAWRWTVGQCVFIGGYEEVVSDLPATTGL
jgi:hypothetical protein